MNKKEAAIFLLLVFNLLMIFGWFLFYQKKVFVDQFSPSDVSRIGTNTHPEDYDYVSCYDSDGGENIFIRGKVYGRRYSLFSPTYPPMEEPYEFWDWCTSSFSVKEWICEDTQSGRRKPFFFKRDCDSGFECLNGKCVESVPECGNGIIEYGEICDGDNLGGESCISQEYDGGDLACASDCTRFNYSNCVVDNPVYGCTVLALPGVYKMPVSIVDATPSVGKHCISIRADNVVLNCLGHEISNQNKEMVGIYSDSDNTVIKNCKINMAFYNSTYPYKGSKGIVLNTSNGSIIEGNYLWKNSVVAIELIDSSNCLIYNNRLVSNNPGTFSDGVGINLGRNSNFCNIQGNLVEQSRIGLDISTSNNLVFNNTIQYNSNRGLKISGSNNQVFRNLFHSNYYGVDSDRITNVSSNLFLGNLRDVLTTFSWTQYNYRDNVFIDTIGTRLNFLSSTRELNIGQSAVFNFSINYVNGNSCSECSYNVTLYPVESDFSHNLIGGRVLGRFTPSRAGLYSLFVEVADGKGNVQNRKYIYLVNGSQMREAVYVFRGFEPVHGQPHSDFGGKDSGALLFAEPASYEERRCSTWVQFSPDEIPFYPYAAYKYLNLSIWYAKANQTVASDFVGFQEIVTFDYTNKDYWKNGIPVTYPGTQPEDGERFAFGSFYLPIGRVADYPKSWNWVALKIVTAFPAVKSQPGNISKVFFGYSTTYTPAIKFVSGTIDVLSATSESGSLRSAEIYFKGGGELVVEMPEYDEYVAYLNGSYCNGSGCLMRQSGRELTFVLADGGTRVIEISNRRKQEYSVE